ncbi:secretion system protein [Betaproteobacteria bacterium]|nr:secretion system protein [Betaproteobacteria bacterium]GHU48222.1 secretion system protein [Betaproteobacteria bacterium]
MASYTYLCLSAQGQEVRGQLDAPDEIEARRQLKSQGLKMLDLQEGRMGVGWLALFRQLAYQLSKMRSIGNNDKVMFYRQMQLMIKAGHTLLEALSACARLTARARLADTLERIAIGIQRGSSLSMACRGEKELFNRLALKLIEAGEASGELGAVFERLAALLERSAEVRRQLITALTYPAFVLLVSVGVIVYLVIKIIPIFSNFLQGRGKALPWEAQTVMDIADWLTRWGWLMGCLALAIGVGLPLLRRVPAACLVMDRLILKLPILGHALIAATMAQVTWTFGVLVKSRLTVLEALRICVQVVGNAAFARAFTRAADQVLTGKSLAVALEDPSLPRLMRHMAAVGEKSGQVDTVMESLGLHYQRELEARIKILSAMIEPVLVLFIGGTVGFVYYAFFKTVLTVTTGA